MIEVRELAKSFGDLKVVNHISFKVAKGKTLVLLGKSGCGKTTTLKMINRLVEPDSGEVIINRRNASKANPEHLRRHIGYVIQDHGLFPHYTVAGNISIVPKLLGYKQSAIDDLTAEVLHSVNLNENVRDKYPDELSGGQQQRVAIARAIATRPPLLLMDEPFSALDPLTRTLVRENFKSLQQQLKITTVLVTHDVSEAVELGDKIYLMDKGKLVQQGKPETLIFHPANDFVSSFFDQNRLENELRSLQLQDVLPFIPERTEGTGKKVTGTDAENLLELMNKISSNGAKYISVKEANGHDRTIKLEDLLSALYKYKEAISN